MDQTSRTWLDALRQSDDGERWQELVAVYGPFIRRILLGEGVLQQETDDIIQDVLAVVVARIRSFDRVRIGSFRAWLRAISVNCLRDHLRRQQRGGMSGSSTVRAVMDELADPHSHLSVRWDEEHDRSVLQYLLNRVEGEFQPTTWQAFYRLAVQEQPADQVATELGITKNAAFIARSRVLKRLRRLGAELIDV